MLFKKYKTENCPGDGCREEAKVFIKRNGVTYDADYPDTWDIEALSKEDYLLLAEEHYILKSKQLQALYTEV
jgi:hypothetical protein